MNEISTDDIREKSASIGLIAYIFESLACQAGEERENSQKFVAEQVSSGNLTIFSDLDWGYLESKAKNGFFPGQNYLCGLIPLLDVRHRDMLRLVRKLVELGGEDLAANWPNAAFRKWCAHDLARAKAVIEDAVAGDQLASQSLSFALEAGTFFDDAMSFCASTSNAEAQLAAVSALGRMELKFEQATTALEQLALIATQEERGMLGNNALLACFSVLGKHEELDRQSVNNALCNVIDDDDPETLYFIAYLMWCHGEALTDENLAQILLALGKIDPQHSGTIEMIDRSSDNLISSGREVQLLDYVKMVTTKTKGQITLQNFKGLSHELTSSNPERLARLVADWLTEGNPSVCRSLSEFLNRTDRDPVVLEIPESAIPDKSLDQYFLCRRAVGYFFMSPVTAASVVVSVLKLGNAEYHEAIEELLFDPLLVSYGGNLRDYLQSALDAVGATCAHPIKNALTRREELMDSYDGLERLVELQPSEEHRQIERLRWQEQMQQGMKQAQSESVFLSLVSKQYLLYGSSSASYFESPNGNLEMSEMQMGEHSITMEYPRLDSVDPIGLQMKLFELRYGEPIRE